MKNLIVIIAFFTSINMTSQGQTVSECAVKIGGNYYYKCKHMIIFEDQDILTLNNTIEAAIGINLDVFSMEGKKVAKVSAGKLTEGDTSAYTIKSTSEEFTLIDNATNRILCYLKVMSKSEAFSCEIHVWADLYMPNGFSFQCTPEETNVPFLQGIKGATFSNSETAIRLK